MTEDRAREVAAGLSKAQREDLFDCDNGGLSISGQGWLGRFRRLKDLGLVRRTRWRVMGRMVHTACYDLTPLGIAVRRILENDE